MTEQQTEQRTKPNFELPVKRVDGDSLEENMTENAYNQILPARYLVRDEDRNVKETPEELYERVAKNVAQPDGEYMDFDKAWKQYYDLMTNLKFMPNSPTLMNAGTDIQQLSACFVINPEDSMESIFNKSKEAALIHKSGGGTGYAFHKLRPKGDKVGSTGGISSGPMSFMDVFDATCGTVKQGGKRRGAQMGIMRVDHPDVLRFITSKRTEDNLTNFNISVGVTHDFVEAVKNDDTYKLINPRTGEPFKVSKQTQQFYNSDEEYYPTASGSDQGMDDNFWRDFADEFPELDEYDIELEVGEDMELPAKFIWQTLVDSAWVKGEPGLFYYDETNDKHSFDIEKHPEKRIEATNPCVARGTLVNTPEGYRRVEEIEEGDQISTVFGSEPVEEIEVNENHPVYRVEFSDGGVQHVTAGHRYHIKEKGSRSKKVKKKRLDEVEEGDYVQVHSSDWEKEGSQRDYEHGLKKGVILGDGSYSEKTVESDSIAICSSEDREEYNENVKEVFGRENFREDDQTEGKGVKMPFTTEAQQQFVQEIEVEPAKSPQRNFDVTQVENKKEAIGILDGLLLTDGRINLHSNHPQAEWTTTSPELAQNIRRLLLSIGCHGRIPDYKATGKGEINGREIERNHSKITVNISGDSLGQYLEESEAGEYDPDFAEDIHEIRTEWMTTGNTWKAEIQSIEKIGTETTYDLYCEDSDTWMTDGYVQQGCGEQPLMNYEACNLGHINLSLLATEQEDGGAYQFAEFKADNPEYDYSDEEELREAVQEYIPQAMEMDEFERIATLGTRFLDNVVTMSDFPLEEIEETVRKHRKIGLGLMGFAQLMIQFGIRYGSDESVAMAEEIQRLITQFSIQASHELAKERGKFEEWEKSKWANPTEYPEWFRQYTGGLDPEDFEDGLALRNHNTTTIAPTGTTSMLGDTSGGCEPIFSMAFFKNVGKDIQGDDMLVEFDDYFIRFLEANGHDVEAVKEEAEKLMRNNEWEDVSSLGVVPEEAEDLFVSADEVEPEEHVDIQAGFQKYNHSGISKTINFGNDATRQDVEDGYLRALEKGIKGITVYRDGSRDVQVKTTRADNKIEEMDTEELVEQIKEGYDSFEEFLQDDEVPIDYKQAVKDEVGKPEFTKKERPQMLAGTTQQVQTGYGDMYVTINKDEDEAFELFANIGKSGGYTESFTEALGRLSSLALRHGIPITEVADQLRGIRSPRMAWDDGEQVHSIPDGIAKAIARQSDTTAGVDTQVSQEGVEVGDDKPEDRDTNGGNKEVEDIVESGASPECPDCGQMLEMKEGCLSCPDPSCGYSKCS